MGRLGADAVPEWFWQLRWTDWGLKGRPGPDNPTKLSDIMRARQEWREARERWLEERGLIAWPMRGVTYRGYERIAQEEPHRVLHRPPSRPLR